MINGEGTEMWDDAANLDAAFRQIVVKDGQREWYISHMTSTMPIFELDFETKVYPIRDDARKNWGLK